MIFAHRINTIEELNQLPKKYGVEIDVRGYGDQLLLNHDPIQNPEQHDNLQEYLENFKHAGIIFNLKEAGYEEKVLELAKQYNIENFFLLDVEFPYLYRATRSEGVRQIAVRYSEAEPIEMVEAQVNDKPLLDWVWIDTNTKLPLTEDIVEKLQPFKTCLVCPERWGRPEDIQPYIEKMKSLNFKLDAVMTNTKFIKQWEDSGIL